MQFEALLTEKFLLPAVGFVYACFVVGMYASFWTWCRNKIYGNSYIDGDQRAGLVFMSIIPALVWPGTILAFWAHALMSRAIPRSYR